MGSTRTLLGLALAVAFAVSAPVAGATCGDGILEQNEECDPGGGLFIDGNPGLATCVTGNDCFYELSCCKFNCQFVGQGAPCFDGNECTSNDVCDQIGNCTNGGNTPANTPCDDGEFCSTGDVCNGAGTCVAGPGSPCTLVECVSGCDEVNDECILDVGAPCTDDGNVCTDDVCDAGGTCTHPNNTAPCDDLTFCNGADTCGGGSCSVHAGDPCTGGSQCADVCDEALDSCNLPNGTACNDGLFCTEVDICTAGICGGSGDPCAGGAECTAFCNEIADDCFDPAGTTCTDDGDICTDDECDGAGTCAHPFNVEPCDDGLTCTVNDACSEGTCTGELPPQCDDGNPCTFDSCVEPSGDCLNLEEPDPTCSLADIGQLVIGNKDDVSAADKLKWKWGRPVGGDTGLEVEEKGAPAPGVGDPLNTTQYDFCIYDTMTPDSNFPDDFDWTLIKYLAIPPSDAWNDRSRKGKWIYKDKSGLLGDGTRIIKLRLGSKPGIGVRAGRKNFDIQAVGSDVFFNEDPIVAVQLSNSEGYCWTTVFDVREGFVAQRNNAKSYRTRRKKVQVN